MQAGILTMIKPLRRTFASNNVKICFSRWTLSFPSSGFRLLEQRPGLSLQEDHMMYFIAAPNSVICTYPVIFVTLKKLINYKVQGEL